MIWTDTGKPQSWPDGGRSFSSTALRKVTSSTGAFEIEAHILNLQLPAISALALPSLTALFLIQVAHCLYSRFP